MNNLEGWGGPNTDEYYERQIALQRLILGRMREFGMEPVLPGYSGMIPHDAASVIGIDVADSGNWLGFVRPAFVMAALIDERTVRNQADIRAHEALEYEILHPVDMKTVVGKAKKAGLNS